MSCSGRLVIHKNRLGWLDAESSSTKFRTSSRADGVPVVLGHSSKASKITKMGSCPGNRSMSSRHFTNAPLLGWSEPSPQVVYN